MIQGAIRVSYKYLPAYEFPHCIYYDCTQSTHRKGGKHHGKQKYEEKRSILLVNKWLIK